MSDDYLFVYGTLMSSATGDLGRDMRVKLAAVSSGIGVGQTPGRLFDLGRYPALADAERDSDTVYGELLRLHAPMQTLAWLDRYEGIDPTSTALDDYRRERRPIETGHAKFLAWVYVYNLDLGDAPRIPDGRWRAQ